MRGSYFRFTLKRVIFYGLLVVVAIWFLIPLMWVLPSSFRPLQEIFKYAAPVSWRTFIPTQPVLTNYRRLLGLVSAYTGSTTALPPYTRALLNSLFITLTTVAIGLVVNSLAGFVFAKFDFPAKRALFLLVLLSFMIPFEVIVIPLYLLMKSWRLTGTYLALILPSFANGLAVFLFKQFFEEIPDSLIESAKIDGASLPQVFLHIIVPNSIPVMICTSMMLFIFQWDTFFWPLVAAPEEKLIVVQVAISRFWGQHGIEWELILAGSVVAAGIPVAIFLILQRYFVGSIALSGIKE